MHIIKLNAIDSTNSFLRRLSAAQNLDDYTVVVTKHQTKGRGQMGTLWESEEAKNLTFSAFKDVSFIDVQHHFYISIVVALSVFEALNQFDIKKLKIKWPNDILSDNKKIAGILIENVIKQNQLQASIIGVGINVNQTNFENLPQASSLNLLSGRVFNVEEILDAIVKRLKVNFESLTNKEGYEILKMRYESHLFRKNKPSTFKNVEGEMFSGFIKGISDYGNLKVLLEDDILKLYDLKEISLMY